MFTTFTEKQERYTPPKPQDKADKTGYIMFTENGGSILPEDATVPGPYPTPPTPPPPPTVYSFTLSYSNTSCIGACTGTPDTTYYSLSSTLGVSSKLYTTSGLTTPVANGYYSEGNNSGNCYDITDSAGTINSISVCPTCYEYTLSTNELLIQFYNYADCSGTPITGAGITSDDGLVTLCAQYNSISIDSSAINVVFNGPCTL